MPHSKVSASERFQLVEQMVKYLKKHNLQQKEFARQSGIHKANISLWGLGRSLPSGANYQKLRNFLGKTEPQQAQQMPNDSTPAARIAAVEALKAFMAETGKAHQEVGDGIGVSQAAVYYWTSSRGLPYTRNIPAIRRYIAVERAKLQDEHTPDAPDFRTAKVEEDTVTLDEAVGLMVEAERQDPAPQFTTRDISLAAFLLMKGAEMVKVERVQSYRRNICDFTLRHADMDSLVASYRSFAEIPLSPAKLFACREQVKQMVYNNAY